MSDKDSGIAPKSKGMIERYEEREKSKYTDVSAEPARLSEINRNLVGQEEPETKILVYKFRRMDRIVKLTRERLRHTKKSRKLIKSWSD